MGIKSLPPENPALKRPRPIVGGLSGMTQDKTSRALPGQFLKSHRPDHVGRILKKLDSLKAHPIQGATANRRLNY